MCQTRFLTNYDVKIENCSRGLDIYLGGNAPDAANSTRHACTLNASSRLQQVTVMQLASAASSSTQVAPKTTRWLLEMQHVIYYRFGPTAVPSSATPA